MKTRIIAKLDIKPPYVIKPIHFEGLRKVGSSIDLAKKYYDQGADELIYVDVVASLYQREILLDEIKKTSTGVFIPFCVGGGVKSLEDFSKLFHSGADKIAINTYAVQNNPEIIDQAAKIFGNQSVVVNIEAKKRSTYYESFTDCGRIPSGKNIIEWVKEVESRGAGEILLQSVDRDGRQNGFDLEIAKKVTEEVNIPVIVASGAGNLEHIKDLIQFANPSGVAIASILHYEKYSIRDIKEFLINHNIEVSM